MRNKNISKEATVAQYIDEFLKGKGEQVCREFRERPVDKQYSSIIQWRRNKRIKERTPRSVTEIHNALAKIGEMIEHVPEIPEADSVKMFRSIEALSDQLRQYLERQKMRRIQMLEEENRRIQEELQALRGY